MSDILIVDDDHAIREMLQEALEDAGYRVLCAEHGAQALEQLRQAVELPRLILLDLMMPVMSGWEFRAQQQADERLAALPVILLSARLGTQRAAPAISADAFIAKPMDLAHLLELVKRFMEGAEREVTG
jgi:CheY-like chemotaxis protein